MRWRHRRRSGPRGRRTAITCRSFGWLVGEVIRRIDGRTVGHFFADEIAAPLGLDYWIGLPASLEPRVATLIPPPPEFLTTMAGLPPEVLLGRVISGPAGRFAYDTRWNERAYHAAELPSSNGIGTAHALARLYASLIGPVDGMRTLRDDTVAAACVVQSNGPDRVILRETCFGTGFMRSPTVALGAGPSAFGHGGAGGSVAFADPEAGISFTYLMNHLRFDLGGDPRNETLVRAVYDCL